MQKQKTVGLQCQTDKRHEKVDVFGCNLPVLTIKNEIENI